MNTYTFSPLVITFKLAILLATLMSCSSKDEIKPTDISGKWISTVQIYETWIDSIKTSINTIPGNRHNYIRIEFNHNGTFHSKSVYSEIAKEGNGKYEITNDTLTMTGTIDAKPFTKKHKLDFTESNGMKMTSQTIDFTFDGKEVKHKAFIDYIRE